MRASIEERGGDDRGKQGETMLIDDSEENGGTKNTEISLSVFIVTFLAIKKIGISCGRGEYSETFFFSILTLIIARK